MRMSEELDIMYKQANAWTDAWDDYDTKVKNGEYNFSNKQKVITGAGAVLGGIGAGLLQNRAYTKAWDDTWQQYQRYKNSGHNRAATSDFSSFGIKPEQFTTKAEFNKWYKSQARKYHPDLNPNNPNAADMMKKVNSFYDNVKNSGWFSKLAFMLENGSLEKRAAIGAALNAGTKVISSVAPKLMSTGSKAMSSSIGKAALNNATGGAVSGAIMGAVNPRPGEDGKNHWIKNSLKGAAAGAGISAAMGAAGAVARTPDFGAKLVSGAKNLSQNNLQSAPGSNPAPIVKPASTTIV